MRKKWLSLLLAAAMLCSLLPAASAAGTQLPTPEVRWLTEDETLEGRQYRAGQAVMTNVPTDIMPNYRVEILNAAGEVVEEYEDGFGGGQKSIQEIWVGWYMDDPGAHLEDGTYTIRVTYLGDNGQTYTDSEPGISNEYTYTYPDTAYDAPTVYWDEANFGYDLPQEALDEDTVLFLDFVRTDGENEGRGGRRAESTRHLQETDNAAFLERFNERLTRYGAGCYKFRIRVISQDITQKWHSEWSEWSEERYVSAEGLSGDGSLADDLDKIIADLGTGETIDTEVKESAVKAVQELDQTGLQQAMSADQEGTGVTQRMAELEEKLGIGAAVKVEDTTLGINAEDVEIVGAGFSASDVTTAPTFTISEPSGDRELSATYKNVVQMELSLSNVTATGEDGELQVPIQITMPVPNGIDPDYLYILHFRQDGTYERFHPYTFTENGRLMARFVVDRLSPFVFAEYRPFTVSFDLNGGTGTAPGSLTTGEDGRLESLPADPVRDGYTFDGWYTAAEGGEKVTTDTVFEEDATLYARWTADQTGTQQLPKPELEWLTGEKTVTVNGTERTYKPGQVLLSEVPTDFPGLQYHVTLKNTTNGETLEEYTEGLEDPGSGYEDIKVGWYANALTEGVYDLTVYYVGDGETWQDSEPVTVRYEYTPPAAGTYAVPTGVEWADGGFAYTVPEEEFGPRDNLFIQFGYFKDDPNSTDPQRVRHRSGDPNASKEERDAAFQERFNDFVSSSSDGYYRFRLRVVSDCITEKASSPWSAWSSARLVTGAPEGLTEALEEIVSGLTDTASDAQKQEAFEAFQALDQEELATALAADREGTGVSVQLAALEEKLGLETTVTVEEGVEGITADAVTVVGAGLNAETLNVTPTFTISPAADEKELPEGYSNDVQLDFELTGVSGTTLEPPIQITMPVPDGLDPQKLRILHYQDGGNMEVIEPYVFQNGMQWMTRFTVDSLSPFVFAEYDEDGSGTGGGTTGGGGGSVTRYEVSVPSDVENGTVKVSPARASRGQTVTITVTPDEGYELDTLTVTDADGKAVELTDKGDGKFTFTMPWGKVSISASFKAVEEEPQPSGLPFTDVAEGAWYYDAVSYAYESGLMTGTSATLFAPSTVTSRAMLATLLWRLEGEPTVTGAASFTDVAAGTWYTDAVAWAASEGVVNGVGDGSAFAPNDTITREQMAVMLYRYAQYKGYDVTQGGMAAREYEDYESISSWAVPAVEWAVNAGLISGTSATTLSPQGSATRAEIATILMRFVESFVPAE